jgi:transposase-like protein
MSGFGVVISDEQTGRSHPPSGDGTSSRRMASWLAEGRAMLVHIQNLMDEAKCFETVRQLRWPEDATGPHCSSKDVTKDGRDDTRPERQRSLCHACRRRFDDLTGTIFAGHHQPLRTWILGLDLRGLNLSNQQIAQELDRNRGDVPEMTTKRRAGVVERRPPGTLAGEVEGDEVSVVAGHKGHPEEVRKKGEKAADAG